MEYIKGGCTDDSNEPCSFCTLNKWTSPQMTRIPQPMPSYTKVGHYRDVFETPIEGRTIDDFAPRANLKKLFKQS